MFVATWSDVAMALGRPESEFSSDQQAQITFWLTGIEIMIRGRLGDISRLDQDAVKYVSAEAVAEKVRRLGRSERETSVTVAVDDGNVTRRFETTDDDKVTADDITAAQWALLTPAASGAFTINPLGRASTSRGYVR